MRVLGIDPGLQITGWGIIDVQGSHLSYVDSGVIRTERGLEDALRLSFIHSELKKIISQYDPDTAGVEETFVSNNAASALKLGQARGVALMTPALMGLQVGEYAPNKIKKSVVGAGHADKKQIQKMVSVLLPASGKCSADEADALAIAITHAHHGVHRALSSALV